jgi:hypothetical protein
MKFQKKWRSFLLEQRYPDLIVEAKVKDIKKKYPLLDEGGWINYARRQIENSLGPRGVSKYLLWFAREMKNKYEEDMGNPPWWPHRTANSPAVLAVADDFLTLISEFEKNQQRMKEKDIYKFDESSLRSALDELPETQAKKRERKKEQAMEGSEIVYDDDDVFAVRPKTKEASCFYGRNTRWCISAEKSRNYFDQYTSDGKGFVMMRFDNIEDNLPLHKIAVVYDSDGEYEEFFDARDDEIGYEAFINAVSLNHKRTGQNPIDDLDDEEREEVEEFADELLLAGSENILTDPPDVTSGWEARINELNEEYHSKIQHGYYDAEVGDYGDGAYVMMSGGFDVELDNSIFEEGEVPLPDDYREIAMLASRISDRVYEAGIFGLEDVEIEDYSGVTRFSFRVSADEAEPNPDGYEYFLDKMAEIDSEHATLRRVVLKFLMDGEFIPDSAFDAFSDSLEIAEPKLNNLKIVKFDTVGEEEIRFESKVSFPVTGMPPRLVYAFGEKVPSGYASTELKQRVDSKLQSLNREIQDYAAKQLVLPIKGLAQKKIQDLSIPETLSVYILDVLQPSTEWLQGKIRLSLENPEADQQEIDVVLNIVEFIDQNYEKVINAVAEAASEIASEVLQAKRDFVEGLPDIARQTIAMAREALTDPSFGGDTRALKSTLDRLDRPEGDHSGQVSISSRFWKSKKLGTENDLYQELARYVLVPLWMYLQRGGVIPQEKEIPFTEDDFFVSEGQAHGHGLGNIDIAEEIDAFLGKGRVTENSFFSEVESAIFEEKGRSRQRGIYKFYCMLSYSLTTESDRVRGLDDILADLRALENVTIVTVVVKNQKISEGAYIAGLSIKFIPSTPGTFRSPEDVKARILRDTKKLQNVKSVFKVSAGLERLE